MAKDDEMPFDLMIAKKGQSMEFVTDVIDEVGHVAEIVGDGIAQATETMGEGGDEDGIYSPGIDGMTVSSLRPGVSLDELVQLREERATRKR